MSLSKVLRLAVAVLALASLVGCGTARQSSRAASTPAAATTSANATSTAEPWVPLGGELGRCGPQPAGLADRPLRTFTLRGGGAVLPAVAVGRGRTVVVLLHQTDGGGLCGWLDFAGQIADVPGQTALAFDLCGYGEARCPGSASTAAQQVDQVGLAIDAAQQRFGARRVVVVGASMGGSLAVLTAAADPRVDAAVDLSGPGEWRGVTVSRSAAGVTVPLLVAMADSDGADEVAAARATAAAAGGEFVGAAGGHGYELLHDPTGGPSAIAAQVLARIAGR